MARPERANVLDVFLRPPVLWFGWLALLVIQIFSFASVRSDDAFISYRYGQNLATGVGLVFNPGERILGSTSPGQMLIAALVYSVAGLQATPSVMATLGCLAWSAQALAVFLLLEKTLGRGGAALIALAVELGATNAQSWVPLETNLVCACVLFGFVAAERGRWYSAAALAAIATLLRPDAWLAALALGTQCIWERRRHALGPIASFGGLSAVWPVFALLYYGSPLPQSALTKYHRTQLLDYALHEVTYPGSLLVPYLPSAVQIALTFGLASAGAWLLLRRNPRLAPFAIYGLVHAAAYLQLRPFMQHQWHLYPWVMVLCVLCGSALVLLAQELAKRGQRALVAGTWVAAGLLLVVHGARFAQSAQNLDADYWTGQRHATYQAISKFLMEQAKPGDWFGSVEVGTIAYYTNLPAFDFGNLVTRPYARLDEHPVHFFVVDKFYIPRDMPVRPVFQSQHGEFLAVVYRR
jgi:hypothetical protein